MTTREIGDIVDDGAEVFIWAVVIVFSFPFIAPIFLIGLIRRGIVWLLK